MPKYVFMCKKCNKVIEMYKSYIDDLASADVTRLVA